MNKAPTSISKIRNTLTDKRAVSVPIGATLLTCIAASLIGNTEQFGHVPYYYMQFLPVRALREEPILSIYNLHSQLPLENALFSLVVNIFRQTSSSPEYANDFWRGDSYWIGVLLKQALFTWLTLFSGFRVYRYYLSERIAIFLTFFIALLPSTMMFFLFPYSAMMCAGIYACLAANVLTEKNDFKRLLITCTCIALLGLSHNLFSYYTTFPLIIAVGLELIKLHRAHRAFISLGLGCILLLPVAWAGKNFLAFGITNLTSWSGCALNQSVSPHMVGTIDSSGKKITEFHGWKEAHARIQIPADYNPNLEIKSPLALNQRMKGEGVRNWNHKSVIESCKASKGESLGYLLNTKQARESFLNAAYQRLWKTSGKLGSEFSCPGCGFGYEFLGFSGVGKVVQTLDSTGLKEWPVRAWTILVLIISPAVASVKFFKLRQQAIPGCYLYMIGFMMVNILVCLMAVALSTIENERMIWMLMPASNIILATAFSRKVKRLT